MPNCIYCDEEADSKEDWLPRGFGAIKGMTLLKDRLCEQCNNTLGHEVDQEVLKTGPTGVLRSLLKIEGRHGVPSPNPFHYKVMGPESATTMTMQCGHADHKILGEPYTDAEGQGHVYPLRQLVFRKSDGEMVCVPFPPKYDGVRLRELIVQRDLEGAKLEEIYLAKDESVENMDTRRVLTDALGHFDAIAYGGVGTSGGRQTTTLSAGISRAYIRGLAKIAFHYYLWTSHIHTGAELIFQPIRQLIRHDEGDWRSYVQLTAPQFIGQLAEGNVPEGTSHFFGVGKHAGHIVSAVQFFVGPGHMTPPSVILLAVTSGHIEPHCHWVSYYGDKLNGYDGEIVEVMDRPRQRDGD
jgi:hypothetical protein